MFSGEDLRAVQEQLDALAREEGGWVRSQHEGMMEEIMGPLPGTEVFAPFLYPGHQSTCARCSSPGFELFEMPTALVIKQRNIEALLKRQDKELQFKLFLLTLCAGGFASLAGRGVALLGSRFAAMAAPAARTALYSEYMYFRAQGNTATAAYRLAQPYQGVGHHFIHQSSFTGSGSGIGRALGWYKDSPLNVLSGRGMSTGRFYELHAQLHGGESFGGRTAQAMRLLPGEPWRAANVPGGLRPFGKLEYLWRGSPTALKLTVGGAAGAGGAGIYGAVKICVNCKKVKE